jgi:hypothetical protein
MSLISLSLSRLKDKCYSEGTGERKRDTRRFCQIKSHKKTNDIMKENSCPKDRKDILCELLLNLINILPEDSLKM